MTRKEIDPEKGIYRFGRHLIINSQIYHGKRRKEKERKRKRNKRELRERKKEIANEKK